MQVKTRFAPSPTGYLHVGGARTALYSWLFAKKNHGKYVLRIEDTDLERSTEEAVQAIFDGLNWLGLKEDEGPYYQTKRFARYKEIIDAWLAEGKAYKCYCTKERLEALREQQLANKEKPRYDGHCRHHTATNAEAPFVVRFKNPEDGAVTVNDLVLGEVIFQNKELDDLIIARTDGTPTYNFTVVVDDYDMQINYVIRGNDHLNNTPRQINMLKALGYEPPYYAHVPMILGDDGKRLSKRHGAVSVLQFRDDGILPEALLNYLVRLGWSHGDQEIFSLDEMIELFDLSGLNKSPCAFDTNKLLWLNQHYIKTLPADRIATALMRQFDSMDFNPLNGPDLADVVIAMRERCKTLKEMAEQSKFFFGDTAEYNMDAVTKHLTEEKKAPLTLLADKLEVLDVWTQDSIKQQINAVGEELGLKLGKYGPAIRVAVTGDTHSPGLDATLETLGKKKSIKRLREALAKIA